MKRRVRAMWQGICRATKKLGYALNHLFWTVKSPWRLINNMADLQAAEEIIFRVMGPTFHSMDNVTRSMA